DRVPLNCVIVIQREGGIRYATMTEVQTYALPNYPIRSRAIREPCRRRIEQHTGAAKLVVEALVLQQHLARIDGVGSRFAAALARSEERRVGIEVRSGWWPLQSL